MLITYSRAIGLMLVVSMIGLPRFAYAQACHVAYDVCYVNSDCCSGVCIQPPPGCSTTLCPTATCLKSTTVHFQTADGQHFLTAVNGGGVGGPNSGPNSGPIHTDATTVGSWETFQCVGSPSGFVLQTTDGNFITAVRGGGIGGPNANPYQLHTDATVADSWETFTIVPIGGTQCAIQTLTGNFVTVVDGGGDDDAANELPIHTNATTASDWEYFFIK